MILYTCSKGTQEVDMENENMNKADLVAILVSIQQVADTNNETKTSEHIKKILEEIRKTH